MTRTTPARRITLHFEQIFLTDVRTTIAFSSCVSSSLVPVDDPPAAKVIRAQLHEHLVAGEDPDEVLAHLPGDVSQHLVLVLQLDLEHRVRERFDDRRGHFDGVFLRHALSLPSSPSLLRPRPRTSPRRPPGTRGTPGLPARSSPENNARIRGRPRRPRPNPRTTGPSAVATTVCSKCADAFPSTVLTVHPSEATRTSAVPRFSIGSIARVIPSRIVSRRPGGP